MPRLAGACRQDDSNVRSGTVPIGGGSLTYDEWLHVHDALETDVPAAKEMAQDILQRHAPPHWIAAVEARDNARQDAARRGR